MEELQMDQESKRGKFSPEFRASALRRLALTANVSELCRELGISRQLLYLWRDAAYRAQQKRSQSAEYRLRRENDELKKALGKKTLEVDFLKAACEKIAALRPSATGSGEMASGKSSGN
jgi:transposase-like protein